MAYSAGNLYNLGTGYPGNAQYTYKSDTDTRETVMASGYFNNTDDNLNLTADDTIFVVGDQGGYTLRVDTVSWYCYHGIGNYPNLYFDSYAGDFYNHQCLFGISV